MTKYDKDTFTDEAAHRQLDKIDQLIGRLGAFGYSVDHYHTSKSIQLPVPTINLPGITLMLRDNFHDVNLYVKSETKIDLPLSFFYKPLDYAWYMDAIESKRNYSFGDWTDAEMADSRILRVKRRNGNGWVEVDGDEKDRWTDRSNSTAWYTNGWSSGLLIPVGSTPFTYDTTFYKASQAYGEGIPHSPKPYSGPCNAFMNAMNDWDELTRLCCGIIEHVNIKEDKQK